MTKRYNATSRVSLAAITLLAAMLFYVSGAALLVHLKLDHAHGPVVVSQVGCNDQHNAPDHTPANIPDTPKKKSCDLCDMLAGSTHQAAVITPSQTLSLADACVYVPAPAETPADRLSAPDISRRGPPSLG